MKIDTRNFGEIEIDENKIFEFEDGLPGFPDDKRFVVLSEEEVDENTVFFWLQSLDDKNVAFVVIDMLIVKHDYKPQVKEELPDYMGDYEESEILIYNIAVVPENVNKMSVNLKAPVVLNNKTKKGCQIIFNEEDYPIRYYIFEEIKNISEDGE